MSNINPKWYWSVDTRDNMELLSKVQITFGNQLVGVTLNIKDENYEQEKVKEN